MIKTLRITSIMTAVLAAGVIVSAAVWGFGGDEPAEILSLAGAIEKFKESRGDNPQSQQDQTSPLVKQAEAFALYLNPPERPKPKTPPGPHKKRIEAVPKPTQVSAKFKLVGTCYYAQNPQLSLALIDQPGKGYRWVKQSSEVGHLIIEQVKDGLIVVRDGQRTEQLIAERPPKRSLLKGDLGSETGSTPTLESPQSPDLGLDEPKADTGRDLQVDIKGDRSSGLAEDAARMHQFMEDLQNMRAKIEDAENVDEKSTEMMEKFISDLKSTRVSPEEANKLEDLGKELGDVSREPNQPKSRKVERSKNSKPSKKPAKK